MLKESKPPVAALPVWAWFVSLSIAAFLCVRNSGIVPFVFSDEYSYSMYTRLAPIAEAIVPDYLYFFVFGVSKECGDGFMDCVRGMNVAIFVASAPFIYMTCRRVAGVVFSCWVTGLAILGPLNSYTAYFMPEATYFFAFWSITWFALSLDENSKTAHWGALGGALGLMALIKPHALFLLPAFCMFTIYLRSRMKWSEIPAAVVTAALVVVSALLAKLIVGYMIAGEAGVTLFGHFYSGTANSAALNSARLVDILRYSLISLGGHVLAITMAFGLSVAAAVGLAVGGAWRGPNRESHRLAVYTILVIGSLLVVVSAFTASLALEAPSELARLHQRYYDFALPLLMLCAAAMTSLPRNVVSPLWRVVLAALLLIAFAFIFHQRFRGFRLGVLDGPWINGLMASRVGFRAVAYVAVLCVIAWIFKPRAASLALLCLALPLSVATAGVAVNRELAQHRELTLYERAGKAAREYVPTSELDRLVIVCADAAEGYRVLFNVDHAGASFQIKPVDTSYDWTQLPDGKSWVMSVGERRLPENAHIVARGNGYVLARAP